MVGCEPVTVLDIQYSPRLCQYYAYGSQTSTENVMPQSPRADPMDTLTKMEWGISDASNSAGTPDRPRRPSTAGTFCLFLRLELRQEEQDH